MPRYAFKIEYDGRPFSGWQRQIEQTTVQGEIEKALRVLQPDFGTIAAAGRTDAGVHAFGQVAHADMAKDWDPFKLGQAVGQHLKPAPISILQCVKVPDDFHARFLATERQYTYRMICRRAPLSIDRGKAWGIKFQLDADLMAEGAAHFIGTHDFTTFRSTICQAKSPVKSIDEIRFETSNYPGGLRIDMHIRARSFLHNQVRSIAGTLAKVGSGSWAPERVRDAMLAKDRSACGPVATSDGLYFSHVQYPVDPFQ